MTTSTIRTPSRLLLFGIPTFIFFTCYLITLSPIFKNNNQLFSLAILGDLLITAPLLYLFVIRRSSISKTTVLRIVFWGIVVAGIILKAESNQVVHFLKIFISPVIETTLIIVLVRKFVQANKIYKVEVAAKGAEVSLDFLAQCRKILIQVLGNKKAADIFASEISVFYYSFFSRTAFVDNQNTFSNYKKSGVTMVLGCLLFVFLIEATGTHFLFAHWNKTTAWIITGLSAYTCLQLFAHIRSIKARVNVIHENVLELHMGMAADAIVEFDNIEKIEVWKRGEVDKSIFRIALIGGLETQNILIELKEPIEIIRMFGMKKKANKILFYVDEPEKFLERFVKTFFLPQRTQSFSQRLQRKIS